MATVMQDSFPGALFKHQFFQPSEGFGGSPLFFNAGYLPILNTQDGFHLQDAADEIRSISDPTAFV